MWTGPSTGTPAWLRVIRDVTCLVIGAGGIVWQLLSGKPDIAVLAFLAALMYAPSVFAIHSLTQPGSGTGGESSPQPSPPASPSPPSSGSSG